MRPDPTVEALIAKCSTPPPPGSPYSLPIPGSERENRSPVYRNWAFRDSPLLDRLEPSCSTYHELFENAWQDRPTKRMLGRRPWNPVTKTWEPRYEWITYAEVAERRKNLGAGVAELHHRIGVTAPNYGVGIWAQNRPEWQITELALVSQSLYAVTLYETLGPQTSEYIINHGELACVVCSLPHVPTLLKIASKCPSLKLIICLDSLDDGEVAGYTKKELLSKVAAESGIQVFSVTEVEEIGQKSGRQMRPPRPEDIFTINYTSGTTGDPKGVLITHANSVAGIACARSSGTVGENDLYLSYLPLAHIYGRMADQAAFLSGAPIGYFHGDVAGLVEDMKILKPTGFMSVPRLFNRFQAAITAATVQADGVKGALSRHVINAKKASMKLPSGKATNKHLIYDKIWTPKVLAAVGLDRVHSMVSGSAQLDPDVQQFLRAAFGNDFVQGFGMTETYAVGMVQYKNDYSTGNIGAPMACVELCLESQPDLEYLVTDKPNPRGELLMRGPIVFKGYYKNDAETQKTIEPDGWFHTGDICEIDSMGRFKIIDRKKNVLKLAQGEYISPERIENVFMANTSLVQTAYVHGDPQQSSLVAVFGIEPELFAPYAGKILKRSVSATDHAALKAAANDPKVRKAFLKQLDDIARKQKFNSYERVRNCYMDIEPFTVDNDLMTPTLKIKRVQTARAFRKRIDEMYEEMAQESDATKAKL
ncbi:Long chain acyl-CoA synthetase 7, peroxisomal [Cytospora mali]|uniref:Long chain acyl-CoA synthetase 7, peroxisomal n=1 Tax=Cytospora mali TaxID=578113 RepID=A0A194V1A1_CYTMA|nr:Long chain acyl-CoA synthetase 7, peroxisomal [Valsa mali var. pyri (nom. inval.)]